MVNLLLLLICTYMHTLLIVLKTMVAFTVIGYFHLRDTMELGNFPTNKNCISEQLMRRFIYESECYHMPLAEIVREEFIAVILNQRCTEVHKRRVLITANHPSMISNSYIYLQYHNTAHLDRLILTILQQRTHIYTMACLLSPVNM